MLQRLFVQNYALIEKVEIQFAAGLNILTGETGAGKSILVDAIGLILGERANPNVMLDTELKCVVEAEFVLPTTDSLQPMLVAEGLEPLDGNLIIRREIAPSGKSRAFVNDTPATLLTLRALTAALVDLHGQHEGQELLSAQQQTQLLDQYAGISTLAAEFGHRLHALRALQDRLQALRGQEQEAKRQLDYYQFQLDELEKANLNVSEDDRLEQDIRRLEHAEQITLALGKAVGVLDQDEQALSTQLAQTLRELEKLTQFEVRLTPELQKLQEALNLLQDATRELESLAADTELEPTQLQALLQRQDVYNMLKLKFAVRTTAELLALQQQFTEKVNHFSSISDQIEQLEKEYIRGADALTQLGLQLEEQRLQAAPNLATSITALLQETGLAGAVLHLNIVRLQSPEGLLQLEGKRIQPTSMGINSVQFLISTNPGMPLAPLAQIASGGEVSRVMLAIKTALAAKLALSTLIFDEIDTGISGEVALKVGRVMERLAASHQVLTITHLPQIASRAGTHYFIYKQVQAGRTSSHIRRLDKPERVNEIAKMISGENPTPFALKNAKELLDKVHAS